MREREGERGRENSIIKPFLNMRVLVKWVRTETHALKKSIGSRLGQLLGLSASAIVYLNQIRTLRPNTHQLSVCTTEHCTSVPQDGIEW